MTWACPEPRSVINWDRLLTNTPVSQSSLCNESSRFNAYKSDWSGDWASYRVYFSSKKREERSEEEECLSNEYDYLLQNVDGVRVLCMQQIHPMPPLDDIDHAFYSIFDEKLHGEMQNKELDLTHLPEHVRKRVWDLVRILVNVCW